MYSMYARDKSLQVFSSSVLVLNRAHTPMARQLGPTGIGRCLGDPDVAVRVPLGVAANGRRLGERLAEDE